MNKIQSCGTIVVKDCVAEGKSNEDEDVEVDVLVLFAPDFWCSDETKKR